MYSDRTGTDKNHPGQNLPDKRPPWQNPGSKNPANNWDRICTRWLLSGFFVLGLLEIGGGVRDVWRTFGGSRDVWRSVTGGRRGKNWPKIAWRTLWTAPYKITSMLNLKKMQLNSTPLQLSTDTYFSRTSTYFKKAKYNLIIRPIVRTCQHAPRNLPIYPIALPNTCSFPPN